MRILIIGSGFLATSIIEKLESEGHELLVFSRKARKNIQCTQIQGDIFDFEEFSRVFKWKPQIIVHTAWITAPELYREDISNFKYAQFTTTLAKYIAKSDVEHLIVLGTCAEYGGQDGPSTAGITNPSPISLYAKQKVTAFNSVSELLEDSDVRFTWARIFYPYGPGHHQKRLIPQIIHSLKNGEPIQLTDISSTYDWITTRDIASATSWVILNNIQIEVDIGTTIGYTNIELLENIEKLLKTSSPLQKHQEHGFGLKETFVVGKNSPLFTSGWLPRDTLLTGLEWVLN